MLYFCLYNVLKKFWSDEVTYISLNPVICMLYSYLKTFQDFMFVNIVNMVFLLGLSHRFSLNLYIY